MINLLPLEEKQKLLFKKKERMTIILGIVVLVFLICLTLILLSIKFYILAQTDYQRSALQQTKREYQTPDFANLNSIIKKYNITLAQLDDFYKKEVYFSQTLKIITDVPEPKGLYLSNFFLSRDKNGLVKVGVSGVSDTRDNLLIFQKNIEGDSKIKNSYFSPESWISPKNVNFSLTFEIDKK